MTAAPVVDGPLWLDRDEEDAALDRFLAPPGPGPVRVPGRPRYLVVDAPPGHGAGSLVARAALRAPERGWSVLHARPRPGPGGPTLLPDLGGRPGPALRSLTGPTLVILDDAHRVAPAEARLLASVLRRAMRGPLLGLVRTWRVGADPPPGVALRLSPGAWDAATVGAATGLPAAQAEALVAAASGIPAVLAPLVRDVRRGVPVTEVDVAAARRRFDAHAVACLPPESARVAAGLAVGEGALPIELVARLLDLGEAPTRRAVAILASAGLLAPQTRAPDHPAAVGPRLRERSVVDRVLAVAAQAGLAASEDLDEADLVSGSGPDAEATEGPEVIGEPLRIGARGGADGVAALARRAAELAHRHGAPDDLVGRVLEHVPAPPAWAEPVLVRAAAVATARRDAASAHAHLESALRVVGRTPQAQDRLRLAAAAVLVPSRPGLADRRLTALVLSGADADVRIGAADQLVMRRDTRTVRTVLARAALAPDRDQAERWTLEALYWTTRGDDPAAPDLDEPEVEPLPELPPDPARAGIAAHLAARSGGARSLAQVRSLARHALGPAGDRPGPVVPRVSACRALVLAEEHDEARSALDRLCADPAVRAAPVLASATWVAVAELELHRGRLGPARLALAETRRGLPREAWHPDGSGLFRALPVMLALAAGDTDEAGRWLADVTEPVLGRSRGILLYARGLQRLAAHATTEAVADLLAAGRDLASHGFTNPSTRPWRSFAALGLLSSGQRTPARTLAQRELELARAWGSDGALGWAHVVVGLVEGNSGRAEVDEGLELLARSGLAHRHGLALTLAARDGHPGRSDMLRRAAVLADETGALARGDRLRSRLRAEGTG